MKLLKLPLDLSWSAILEGQNYMDFAPRTIRALATDRIQNAEGDALMPLSELASMGDSETQQFIGEQIGELARMEQMPEELHHREWRAFHLEKLLEILDCPLDVEDPESDIIYRLTDLREFWWQHMKPLDVPCDLYTFGNYDSSDLMTAITKNRTWLKQETELIRNLKILLKAGQFDPLSTLLTRLQDARLHEWQ